MVHALSALAVLACYALVAADKMARRSNQGGPATIDIEKLKKSTHLRALDLPVPRPASQLAGVWRRKEISRRADEGRVLLPKVYLGKATVFARADIDKSNMNCRHVCATCLCKHEPVPLSWKLQKKRPAPSEKHNYAQSEGQEQSSFPNVDDSSRRHGRAFRTIRLAIN